MKHFFATTFFLSILAVACASPVPTLTRQPELAYRVDVNIITDQHSIKGQLYFLESSAIELLSNPSKPDAVYDLASMSWKEPNAIRPGRFSECEAWVNASVEKTRTSLANMKDGIEKQFTESLLTPNFQVESYQDGKLVLKNGFFLYEISMSQRLPSSFLKQFFTYYQLSECREAMVERKFPPFTSYAALEQLKAQDLFPNNMQVTISLPSGKSTLRCSFYAERMTESDRVFAQSLLSK